MIELISLVSAIALGLAFFVPGFADLILLAGPMALGSLFLVVRRWLGGRRPKAKHLVIDGSNVLHWNDNQPDIRSVRQAVKLVMAAGYTPGVIFDANVGYKIGTRYLDDADLARLLDLPVDRVLVVPKGVVADKYILKSARDLGARIVTNDRYREWAESYPEVITPGFLITGAVHDGAVRLDGV